eukprot:2262704-Pyramimonas_sp.AAC.1
MMRAPRTRLSKFSSCQESHATDTWDEVQTRGRRRARMPKSVSNRRFRKGAKVRCPDRIYQHMVLRTFLQTSSARGL